MGLKKIIAGTLVGLAALAMPAIADAALSAKSQAYLDYLRSKQNASVLMTSDSSKSVVQPRHSYASNIRSLRSSRESIDHVLNRRLVRRDKFRMEYGEDLESRIGKPNPEFVTVRPGNRVFSLKDYKVRSEFDTMMRERKSYDEVMGFLKDKTEKQKLLALLSMGGKAGWKMYDHARSVERVSVPNFFNKLQDAYNGVGSKFGVCRHIHGALAQVARSIGLGAYGASVEVKAGGHLVMPVYTKELGWIVVDYGRYHLTGARTLSKAMRFYQSRQGIPLLKHEIFNGKFVGSAYSETYKQLNEFMGVNRDGVWSDSKDMLLRRNVVDQTEVTVKNTGDERSVTVKGKQQLTEDDGDLGKGSFVVKYGELDLSDRGTTARVGALGYGIDQPNVKAFGGLIRLKDEDYAATFLRACGSVAGENGARTGFRYVLGGDIYSDVQRTNANSPDSGSMINDLQFMLGISKFKKSRNSRTDIYAMANFDLSGPEDYNYDEGGFDPPIISKRTFGINHGLRLGKSRLDINPELEYTWQHKLKNLELYGISKGFRLRGKCSLGEPRDPVFSNTTRFEGEAEVDIGKNLSFALQYSKTTDEYLGATETDEKKFGLVRLRF